ncbi:MAG: DNA/RNA non-specific endonuclease [Rhodocyclales bacterium]|nr:DNA/RNA non-specific endonuclease [Rhodocyclales bacterium]
MLLVTAQRTIGAGDGRLPDDQGGHLIGSQFGGYGGPENLTPMHKDINKYHGGSWGDMERNWAEHLKAGDTVHVKIELNYADDTMRAGSFDVIETVNGKDNFKIIDNPR